MRTLLHQIFRTLFPHHDPTEVRQRYGLPERLSLSIRLTERGWLVATSPDLPGLITQARNEQELLEMVNDAVLTYFDVPRREADIIYDRLDHQGRTFQYQAMLQAQTA